MAMPMGLVAVPLPQALADERRRRVRKAVMRGCATARTITRFCPGRCC